MIRANIIPFHPRVHSAPERRVRRAAALLARMTPTTGSNMALPGAHMADSGYAVQLPEKGICKECIMYTGLWEAPEPPQDMLSARSGLLIALHLCSEPHGDRYDSTQALDKFHLFCFVPV